MKEQTFRIDYLDSARGLASLAVAFGHFMLAFDLYGSIAWVHYSPIHIFYDGFAAVSFFFVLSGFILSSKYFSDTPPTIDISSYTSYVVKRFFRIYPLYIFLIVASIVLKILFFSQMLTTPALSSWLHSMWSENGILDYFLSKAYFLPRRSTFIPQAWTLGIELLFLLMVPFAVLAVRCNVFAMVITIVIAIFFTTTAVFALHFLIGILVAYYFDSICKKMSSVSRRGKYLLLAASVSLYTMRHTLPEYLSRSGISKSFVENEKLIWVITGVGAAGILVSIANSQKLKETLNHRWLTFIGRISYSIYLCHMIMLVLIMPKVINWLNSYMGIKMPQTITVISFLIVMSLTLVLSWGLHDTIEQPFIRMGKILSKNIELNLAKNK